MEAGRHGIAKRDVRSKHTATIRAKGYDVSPVRIGTQCLFGLTVNGLLAQIGGGPQSREDRQALHGTVERIVDGGSDQTHRLHLRALALVLLHLLMEVQHRRREEPDRNDADELHLKQVPANAAACVHGRRLSVVAILRDSFGAECLSYKSPSTSRRNSGTSCRLCWHGD